MKIAANDKETYLPYVDAYLEQKTDKDEIIGLRKLEEMAAMISPDVPMKYTKRAISSFTYILWYLIAKKRRNLTIPGFATVTVEKQGRAWLLTIKATAKIKANKPYKNTEKVTGIEEEKDD